MVSQNYFWRKQVFQPQPWHPSATGPILELPASAFRGSLQHGRQQESHGISCPTWTGSWKLWLYGDGKPTSKRPLGLHHSHHSQMSANYWNAEAEDKNKTRTISTSTAATPTPTEPAAAAAAGTNTNKNTNTNTDTTTTATSNNNNNNKKKKTLLTRTTTTNNTNTDTTTITATTSNNNQRYHH